MWRSITKQFLIGGTLTSAISYFALSEGAHIPVSTAGFLYGAPILIPYLSLLTYNSRGGDATVTFNKHVLLGLMCSVILLLSWIFIKDLGFNVVVGFNLVYMVVVYAWYFWGARPPRTPHSLRS